MTSEFYTAYGLTPRGQEEIERYATIDEAVQDMLEMWPEEPNHDAVIQNSSGRAVVYLAHGTSPEVCLVIPISPFTKGESYRVEYKLVEGRVNSVVTKLA